MATHDYIISNASGAAVRADLNNALAAIVSNNSNASSPATTYAYQWWADTTTGQLKLRNSANNAWITIFELDGTMLMEDGTVSAPGLAFASDLNTGFFRSAADKINFATGGVERLEIGSSEVVFNDGSNDVDFRVESNGNANMLFVDGGNDRVGIGISSPGTPLEIAGSVSTLLRLDSSNGNGGVIRIRNGGADKHFFGSAADFMTGGTADQTAIRSNSDILFGISSNEKARLDSSGRLLVGTTSSTKNIQDNDKQAIVLQGNANNGGLSVTTYNGTSFSNSTGPRLNFQRSRGTTDGTMTVVTPGDLLGEVEFRGADGTNFISAATINAFSDGTPGANDMPGRLVFSTSSDGASSPTERLKIDSSGNLNFAQEASSSYPEQKLKWSNDSTTANGFYISQDSSRNGKIFHEQGLDILFGTNNTERARLDSSGRLLVGTSSDLSGNDADVKLQVSSSGGPTIQLARNDSSTVSNNLLGAIVGSTTDGGASQRACQINFRADGDQASNDHPGRIEFSTCADGASSPTERMRINAGGNVGIGTTECDVALHVAATAGGDVATVAEFENLGTSNNSAVRLLLRSQAGSTNTDAYIQNTGSSGGNSNLLFATEGSNSLTERMRLDSSGNLLIGRTSSGQTGNGHSIRATDSAIFSRDSSGETMIVGRNDSQGSLIQFRRNNTICGNIQNIGGTSVAYQTSSDYRLKENVVDIADGITRVKQLSPKRFNFIVDADTTVDGFLAHEAQTVVPEAVTGTHDEVDSDGNPEYQGIDPSKLVPLLTAALQEAITKIETLETKVAALEAG